MITTVFMLVWLTESNVGDVLNVNVECILPIRKTQASIHKMSLELLWLVKLKLSNKNISCATKNCIVIEI